jgi:hypothetical protein
LISVIVYGRNDSYGYNLHKRAAISLNCIAEVLTHPGDEIIFVDCNSPDDIPTFPEAIQDTLTPNARELIRILRLRPHVYERYNNGSSLKVLEPLSRNIALRRSNPSNRWILSTNTDMIFVMRKPGKSLSDIAAKLPNGFYELPRFEVPEALWEELNRFDPSQVIETLRLWGQRLHLNEVIICRPDIRFDGPGDFQLMLRDQIFTIHGFNEQMVLGWHVDSNLCRRLFLLNGKTDSLLDNVFAYHCDHSRQGTFMHGAQRTENDQNHFIFNVTSSFIPDQAETWGIPLEDIEEIHMADGSRAGFNVIIEDLLPGLSEATVSDFFVAESYNHGVIYDTMHVFPFLANHLSNISSDANVGYCGGNLETLQLMSKFFDESGHEGNLLANRELIPDMRSKEGILPDSCALVDNKRLCEQSDIFVFDAAMMHFPQMKNFAGIPLPAFSKRAADFVKKLQASFLRCVEAEARRLRSGRKMPRKFILIGSQHTWFEGFCSLFIEAGFTPYSSHVRHGYIRSTASPFSLTSRVRRLIMRFGFNNKEKIKRIPLLNKVARMLYRSLRAPAKKNT